MTKEKGYVSFVLHAHLPFIHHPESEDYLEEQWLYEAISETYIPLLLNFKKLEEEKVDFRITMSLTPPLLNMLDNKLLQERYIKYLKKHIELSEKEVKRTTYDERLNKLSKYYLERYTNDLHVFKDVYNCNLIQGFKYFQDKGYLEIITCGATHGYFPILYITEQTVKAQIAVGVQTYEKYFGRKPRGIWLPECGYVPEADKYLKEFGIDYIITESHGILYADPTPVYGTFAPIVSPEGVIAFGRDIESSRQVWSSINGYPGDFNYREFYRDIGYDTDYDYIKPYIASNGVRVHTGIKYYRITGKDCEKDYYDLQWAKDSAEKQAGHFFDSRTAQIEKRRTVGIRQIVISLSMDDLSVSVDRQRRAVFRTDKRSAPIVQSRIRSIRTDGSVTPFALFVRHEAHPPSILPIPKAVTWILFSRRSDKRYL